MKGAFVPTIRRETGPFLSPVSDRCQRGSILAGSNAGIEDWPAIVASDEVLATANLDRLLPNSHVLSVKGRSDRLRDLERAVTQQGA